jgi:hypothetical protein
MFNLIYLNSCGVGVSDWVHKDYALLTNFKPKDEHIHREHGHLDVEAYQTFSNLLIDHTGTML